MYGCGKASWCQAKESGQGIRSLKKLKITLFEWFSIAPGKKSRNLGLTFKALYDWAKETTAPLTAGLCTYILISVPIEQLTFLQNALSLLIHFTHSAPYGELLLIL